MVARKSGRIVNIASAAGCSLLLNCRRMYPAQPIPELSAYVVSKTALIGFSERSPSSCIRMA